MSNIIASSGFFNRVFLNRSNILNLYNNESNINNDVFLLPSLNIKNVTVSNNNLTFLKNDFDVYMWNDRQYNNNSTNNSYVKLNDIDKVIMINVIFDKKMGKYNYKDNNGNVQINLMNIVDGKINLNTIFESLYDYEETNDSFTLKFKVNAEIKYNNDIVYNNIPDGQYELVLIEIDFIPLISFFINMALTAYNLFSSKQNAAEVLKLAEQFAKSLGINISGLRQVNKFLKDQGFSTI